LYRHLASKQADTFVYTDAASTKAMMGVYVESRWVQFQWPFQTVSINILEFLASIVGYLFCAYLFPDRRHCHLYIDNTNAKTWSEGRIQTDSKLARQLFLFNCSAQNNYSLLLQTREYIPTDLNIHADAISRKNRSVMLSLGIIDSNRYQLTPAFWDILGSLNRTSNDDPWENPHIISKLWGIISFKPFAEP
jgi:hypothetical protein